MRIFSTKQYSKIVAEYLKFSNLRSIDLMENVGKQLYKFIFTDLSPEVHAHIFCGVGQNGGEGLALARILLKNSIKHTIHLVKTNENLNLDAATFEKLYWEDGGSIHYIKTTEDIPDLEVPEPILVIDAIFGSGIDGQVKGIAKEVIDSINQIDEPIYSIDLPSGMHPDELTENDTIVMADMVINIQLPKMAMFLRENEEYIREWTMLDVGVPFEILISEETAYSVIFRPEVLQFVHPMPKFDTKYDRGSALILADRVGNAGASILSGKAAMRTGLGEVTLGVSNRNYTAVQAALPEAHCQVLGELNLIKQPDLESADVIAIAENIGLSAETSKMIEQLIKNNEDLAYIVEAGEEGIFAKNPKLLKKLPPLSIILLANDQDEWLIGEYEDSLEQMKNAQNYARTTGMIVVLKGTYTRIILPDGGVYINHTGAAGMATNNSGDVLLGILAGLLARSMDPIEAIMLGVPWHGYAGMKAAEKHTDECMMASDIIAQMGKALKEMGM
jgi:ADP-dependent NAD(P)H-hydrate dehydratase / NAD(P)H-hydrate epimerase